MDIEDRLLRSSKCWSFISLRNENVLQNAWGISNHEISPELLIQSFCLCFPHTDMNDKLMTLYFISGSKLNNTLWAKVSQRTAIAVLASLFENRLSPKAARKNILRDYLLSEKRLELFTNTHPLSVRTMQNHVPPECAALLALKSGCIVVESVTMLLCVYTCLSVIYLWACFYIDIYVQTVSVCCACLCKWLGLAFKIDHLDGHSSKIYVSKKSESTEII